MVPATKVRVPFDLALECADRIDYRAPLILKFATVRVDVSAPSPSSQDLLPKAPNPQVPSRSPSTRTDATAIHHPGPPLTLKSPTVGSPILYFFHPCYHLRVLTIRHSNLIFPNYGFAGNTTDTPTLTAPSPNGASPSRRPPCSGLTAFSTLGMFTFTGT